VALREYRDQNGVLWRVWHVQPGMMVSDRGAVADELQGGWLCFECDDGEKRRLRPVPASWEERSDHELDILRRAADPVRKVDVRLGDP